MRVEGDILINRPVEQVFDFVADERNEPLYNPQMTRAEKVTPGPVGAGTRFHSVMTGAGRATALTVELTGYDRPVRLASRATTAGMDIEGVLLFDDAGGATRMRWLWELRPHGLVRLLGPLLRAVGERQERRIWTSLKRLLESTP